MFGQGDRDGGGPAGRATEGNAGPAWFPAHLQGVSRASGHFEDSVKLPAGHQLTYRREPARLFPSPHRNARP